jgi:hypothetical protein
LGWICIQYQPQYKWGILVLLFWITATCILAVCYEGFRGTCVIHFHGVFLPKFRKHLGDFHIVKLRRL